jgi:hypothetical protein
LLAFNESSAVRWAVFVLVLAAGWLLFFWLANLGGSTSSPPSVATASAPPNAV